MKINSQNHSSNLELALQEFPSTYIANLLNMEEVVN